MKSSTTQREVLTKISTDYSRTHPHIKRALFNAYSIMHVMDAGSMIPLKPLNFGFKYEADSEMLIPEISWKSLPSHWSVVCSCSKCNRSTCPCRVAAVRCVKYCVCKKVNPSSRKNQLCNML